MASGLTKNFGKLVGGALRAMGLGMVYPKFSSRYSKYSAPWAKDEGCVMCQYLLEMTEVDLWQNGIRRYPGMARRDWRERVRSFYSAAKWGRNTSKTAKFMVDTADAKWGFCLKPKWLVLLKWRLQNAWSRGTSAWNLTKLNGTLLRTR